MQTSHLKTLVLQVFVTGAAFFAATNISAHGFIDPPSFTTPKNITVYVAKKIITMDPAMPTATAVAVADGKILSVGSIADLKPWTDQYPTRIDRQFESKVLYPGFVDPHQHPFFAGVTQTSYPLTYLPLPSPWGKPFPGVKDLDAAIAKLKEYSAGMADPNQTLLAWGYDIVAMKRMPNKDLLDQVSLTRPILVWDSSEHNIFFNSAALKKYIKNIDEAKKIPGVGFNPDGSLNGQFLGAIATPYAVKFAAKDLFTPERIQRAMLYSNDIAQQGGITTTSEMTFGIVDIELEKELAKKFTSSDVTSLRVLQVAYADSFLEKYGDQAIAKVKELQKLETDRLFYRGVKFMGDDAYLSNTMRVDSPGYTDGRVGTIFYPSPESLAIAMQPWWNSGFKIHVHSNGSAGIENTLNALQILQDRRPRFDHRFTLEHLGLPTSMMVRKIKALGAVASVNPSYFYQRANIQFPELGYDRAAYATRVGMLASQGVVVALHSDNPVTTPKPLTQVWAVVNRQGLYSGDKKWAPAEAVTVEQAMRMITIDAAYIMGLENKVGSIEPGKYADFTVLVADPAVVPKSKIKDVPIIGTVLGGRYIPVSETSRERPY